MTRVVSIACVAIVAVGCRGIIGIDDLTLVDGGADGGGPKDAGGDTSAADTGGMDAGPDVGAPCGNTTTRQDCTTCCFNSHMGPVGGAFANLADQQDTCACMQCNSMGHTECMGYKVCGGSSTAQMSPCLPCLGNVLIQGSCSSFTTRCDQDSSCKVMDDCMRTCRPLPP